MPQLVTPRLAAQLQRMTEGATYTDTAYYIPEASGALDEYGQPTPSTTRTLVSCSFTDKPSSEKWKGYADVEELAAEIRLSALIPTKGGRVTIVSRFGEEVVTQQTYEVIGIQDRATFGYVCALKVVTI